MAADVTRLVVANELYLLTGVGVAMLLGLADARRASWRRLGAAYLVGLAAVGVLSSYLSLLGVAIGWLGLFALAVLALTAGVVRLVRSADAALSQPLEPLPWSRSNRLAGIVLLAAALALLAFAARTFAVRPLVEWDGWAQWALKARVLYELPDEAAGVLRDADYGHPTYPLLMPSLEAIGFRAIGRFDGTLADLQLLGLALGFVLALWAFLRDRCPPALLGLTALAVVGAPQFLFQLSTNFADVPLAIFVGAGLAAVGRWLAGDPRERWPLACGVLLLGAAGVTKNEGLLFASAAALALLLVAGVEASRRRSALVAAAGLAAIVVPWRIYVTAYAIPTSDYDLSDALDPAYLAERSSRIRPVADELWVQLTHVPNWGVLLGVFAVAVAGALVSGRFGLAAFAGFWVALSFGGLLVTYWISTLPLANNLTNSSYRTVVSILVGGASLVPVLLAASWATVSAAAETSLRRPP